jgi:hypothetical protein
VPDALSHGVALLRLHGDVDAVIVVRAYALVQFCQQLRLLPRPS